MSLFNGLFSGLLRAGSLINDPFRVIEANVEDYIGYDPVCRDDSLGCLVLYKTGENDTLKMDIVFQTHIIHSTKKVFSLYRTTDEIDAQVIFCQMCGKLPVLVECYPDLVMSKTSLQEVSQVIRDHPSWTSAHIAAHFGCLKTSQTETIKNNLILSQINVVCQDTLETPLHIAIKAQQIASVSALVSLDARMDIVDVAGDTVLHYAAITTKEIIQILTAKPVAAIINLKNYKGCTALHLACMANKPECVMELLRAGADVNIVCEIDDQEEVDDTDMPDVEVTQKNMKEVLDARSHQFYMSDIKHGGTPLHWSKTKELIEVLIDYGCNVNSRNFEGETALHVMVKHNRLSCAVTLLSYHANVDMQNAAGNTPLHIAAKCGDITFIHLLVAFGANINLANNKGETPRHIVAIGKKSGYGEMLYALHIVGAERCSKGMYSCNEGCIFGGQFNGIPPENSPISDQSELFDELLSDIIKTNSSSSTESQKLYNHPSAASGDADKKCRVLSLDGGGIRGLVLIQLLYELEKVVGVPIIHCFDWVAGTSTGGILALVLATGKSIKDTRCVYFQLKDKVFVGTRPYDAESLEVILKRELGSTSVMSDIAYPRIMLTATKGDRKPAELHIFRNYPSPLNILGHDEIDSLRENCPIPKPKDQLIWHAARSTGAAPTYFRASGQYLDGGLIANNPTIDALTEIHQCNQAYVAMGQADEVFSISCIVSLGTGKSPLVPIDTIDVFRPDTLWGACKMALGVTALGQLLIDQATQTDGRVITRSRSLCSMLNIPYYRINPQLSEYISLDETDDRILAKMLWETTAYMHSIKDRLERLATLLRP